MEGSKNFKNDFFLTYGDGVVNVDLYKLTKYHFKLKYLTMTVVLAFGEVEIENNLVLNLRKNHNYKRDG